MKKLVLVSLVLTLALVFAFAAFQAPTVAAAAPAGELSFQITPPPLPGPCVGWNS